MSRQVCDFLGVVSFTRTGDTTQLNRLTLDRNGKSLTIGSLGSTPRMMLYCGRAGWQDIPSPDNLIGVYLPGGMKKSRLMSHLPKAYSSAIMHFEDGTSAVYFKDISEDWYSKTHVELALSGTDSIERDIVNHITRSLSTKVEFCGLFIKGSRHFVSLGQMPDVDIQSVCERVIYRNVLYPADSNKTFGLKGGKIWKILYAGIIRKYNPAWMSAGEVEECFMVRLPYNVKEADFGKHDNIIQGLIKIIESGEKM